jgi:hypothetical protein
MTRIGSLAVSRLVMGGNPISGFSHGSRDQEMLDYFTTDNIKKLLRRCEKAGINTVFLRADKHIMRVLHEYRLEGGKLQWVAQSAPEIDPDRGLAQAKSFGAAAIYVHGGQVDTDFEKGNEKETLRQINLIRGMGLPAGVASHTPANVKKIVDWGWPVDFFMICLYNIPGYRGTLSASQDEKFHDADRVKALELFRQIEQPCFAYKILAAGRKDPRESFEEVARYIKPIDGVNLGMYPPDSPTIVEDNVAMATELLPRHPAASPAGRGPR